MSQLRRPETRYARSGDVSLAYQVVGDGPPDLVYVWGTYSHVELHWEEPAVARHLRRLAGFARLITFDKRGTGLSDRVAGVPTMEERMDDIRAVMDAAGSERAVLVGLSEGATLAALFAAAYPERAAALILYGGIASFVRRPDYPWRPPADEERRIDTLAQTMHQDRGIPERFATMLQRGAPLCWLVCPSTPASSPYGDECAKKRRGRANQPTQRARPTRATA
jgi:pimeloyl-ACP methyl ester carboxylesterase